MKNPFHEKLNSPNHELVEKYIRVTKLHRCVIERALNDTGVYRSQHQILMYVADNPNVSQKDIANLHGVSSATIAVTLKKLEQGGYIRRIVDQKDNRINQICITEKGNGIVADSFRIFQHMEEHMFHDFSEEEFRVMGQLLDKIYVNLKCELHPKTEREDI